jgi:hypothetical protein
VGLGEVGGYIGYDGGPKLVYDIREGYWSVIVEYGGVRFFVYEAGVAGHPLFWCVSVAGHALVEEEKGSVEGGRHGLQDFGWNIIWAWGFAFGHAV